jgi:hypothetical protein
MLDVGIILGKRKIMKIINQKKIVITLEGQEEYDILLHNLLKANIQFEKTHDPNIGFSHKGSMRIYKVEKAVEVWKQLTDALS